MTDSPINDHTTVNLYGLFTNIEGRKKRFVIPATVGVVILLAVIAFITLVATGATMRKKYDVVKPGRDYSFPIDEIPIYIVNFNTTIMQANYVYYISTSGGHSCGNCNKRADPYGVDQLKPGDYDYQRNWYQMGHLVPNADYGYDTMVMQNMVPMTSKFNGGTWANSEAYIRKRYFGYLVYKGCDYDYSIYKPTLSTSTFRKLYIPIGCYWIVFNSKSLNGLPAKIKDYGYYYNKNETQPQLSKLPYWMKAL